MSSLLPALDPLPSEILLASIAQMSPKVRSNRGQDVSQCPRGLEHLRGQFTQEEIVEARAEAQRIMLTEFEDFPKWNDIAV